jgi:hypothetical protein
MLYLWASYVTSQRAHTHTHTHTHTYIYIYIYRVLCKLPLWTFQKSTYRHMEFLGIFNVVFKKRVRYITSMGPERDRSNNRYVVSMGSIRDRFNKRYIVSMSCMRDRSTVHGSQESQSAMRDCTHVTSLQTFQ